VLASRGQEIQSLAPGAMRWQNSISTTHVCNCKMHHDVIALSKDTLGLNVVSCPFGFWIWWRAYDGAVDIGETTAKYSLRNYYAHFVHYADYAHYAHYVLNDKRLTDPKLFRAFQAQDDPEFPWSCAQH